MDISIFTFKAIDVIMDCFQNMKRYKDIEVIKDVVYNEEYKDACVCDLYFRKKRKEDKKYPVIINVHGGGFVAGNKKHRRSMCSYFADMGFFVVNICYGLSPKYRFDDYIRHLAYACNFIPTLAKDFDIDVNRVVVTGDSAGGHAAAVMGALYADPEYCDVFSAEHITDIKITHVVPFCGSYDILMMFDKAPKFIARPLLENMIDMKVDKKFENVKNYKFYNELSVLDRINKNYPKCFIIQGKNDIFCPGQGDLLKAKLEEAGVEYEEYYGKRLLDTHCFHLIAPQRSTKECLQKLREYLSKEVINK